MMHIKKTITTSRTHNSILPHTRLRSLLSPDLLSLNPFVYVPAIGMPLTEKLLRQEKRRIEIMAS